MFIVLKFSTMTFISLFLSLNVWAASPEIKISFHRQLGAASSEGFELSCAKDQAKCEIASMINRQEVEKKTCTRLAVEAVLTKMKLDAKKATRTVSGSNDKTVSWSVQKGTSVWEDAIGTGEVSDDPKFLARKKQFLLLESGLRKLTSN